MIVYKDKTFCEFLECTHSNCHRRLTETVRKDASDFGLPYFAVFTDKPECYTEDKNVKINEHGIYN